ncbi:MAG TPA: hypothetical protein VKU88_01805 [Acidimicrobiales bacterium]|nr:hypothetical protein [Acidimicrobiales bacterium]
MRLKPHALAGAALVLAAFGAGPAALAATSGSGTTSASILGGSLSVSNVGTMSALAPAIGGTATGALPSAQWADDTGTGDGWNGTVAVSPLNYTGSWVAASGSTALASASAGTYTGTADGVEYTVKVTTGGLGDVVAFSYTSSDPTDASGTGTASTTGTASVGTHGLSINFSITSTYSVGNTYTVLCGTQSASALTVDTAAATAVTSTNTTSPPPTYVSNGATINAGSTVGTVNTSGAVKVLSAAVGQGASGTGYYTAAPGVQIAADSNSWAKTYTGTLTYSIVSGP